MSMELRTWYQAISTVENKSRTVLWVHVLFFHVFDHKSMKTEGKKGKYDVSDSKSSLRIKGKTGSTTQKKSN